MRTAKEVVPMPNGIPMSAKTQVKPVTQEHHHHRAKVGSGTILLREDATTAGATEIRTARIRITEVDSMRDTTHRTETGTESLDATRVDATVAMIREAELTTVAGKGEILTTETEGGTTEGQTDKILDWRLSRR